MNRIEKEFDQKHPDKRREIRTHINKELKRLKIVGFPDRRDLSGIAASITKRILTILEGE